MKKLAILVGLAMALALALPGGTDAAAISEQERPVVSYFEETNEVLKVLRCADAVCSGKATPSPLPLIPAKLVQVGFENLGGNGFNGDIWVHGDYAYVGTFGVDGDCPNIGVKVVDISNPFAPTMVDVLSVPSGSHPSDVKVASINTSFFQGDLLVNSNEACATGGSNGIQLWDVTDPLNPLALNRFDTGGVHNTYLYQIGDRAYVLLAVPFAEVFGTSNALPASDLQIVDVTDPANPVLAGEWTLGRDAGLAFGAPRFAGEPLLPPGSDCTPPPATPPLCRGAVAMVYLHDVWASTDGAVAYLSYWDAGLVTLDISDPANPTLLAVATEPLSDEGNAHNAVVDEFSNLILVGDEDIEPGPWGFLRVFDGSDPAAPVQIGTFATTNALADPPPDSGLYSLHNITMADGTAYLAWFSDGVRVLDLSDPSAPKERASFVPPDVPDPFGFFPPKALVWGVSVQDDIVFASDINGGLYVLAFDSDNDSCADIQELGNNEILGGQRDPDNFWDFFDPNRDGSVTLLDFLAILRHFGTVGDPATLDLDGPEPPTGEYWALADRGGQAPGGDPWDELPANGSIGLADFLSLLRQFGHTCA